MLRSLMSRKARLVLRFSRFSRSVPLVFLFLIAAKANATTLTAASCSAGDVQTKLNQAAAGDIVVIPACPNGVAWNTRILWSAPPNVVLQGAGTSAVGGGDQTVIIDNYPSDNSLLYINPSTTGTFR